MSKVPDSHFNFECRRKSFHLLSLIVPLTYLMVSKLSMSILLLFWMTITLYLDISRHYNPQIKDLIQKIFGNIIRLQEKSGKFNLSGVSFMAMGFLIPCLMCSKGLAINSWLILIISDCLAALVGTKIGTPLSNGKSIAGSLAFVTSALIVSLVCYFLIPFDTTPSVILAGCILTGLVEFYSKTIWINDNLSIPLTYALSTYVGNSIF